ncbi:ABC transporter substrate-binding protein [Cohnella fermenti]|uniref:Extracellular solute-binding protein n=1 Tax=Cohnella fermenti TaxID=2565925 RepID=A0A4S4C9M7_9BACL|nr:extracellular solute-binding protein [Cohnella fermenti]THF84101.1 extracellular solute-binding protein [Cohnella fermenti]
MKTAKRGLTGIIAASLLLAAACSNESGSPQESGAGTGGDTAGTASAAASTAAASADGEGIQPINDGKPVKLVVNLGEYNPSLNEEATAEQPVVFRSTQLLADKFMELHPNVTIEWDRSSPASGSDYIEGINQWMTPRLAAGTAMDVASNLAGAAVFGNNGWFLDLESYLDQPNPYAEGNGKWSELWPDYQWSASGVKNIKGETLGLPFMVSAGPPTAYYYNKEIFAELNLETPKTWEEFINVSKTINDAGYIAVAPFPGNKSMDLQVWDTQFSLGPAFGLAIMDEIDTNKDGALDSLERLQAVKEGYYDPSKHDNAMEIWRQVKRKYTEVLQKGYESTDYEPLWQEGKVAMLEDGLWRLPNELANTKRTFDFGMIPPPVITKETTPLVGDISFTEKGPYQPAPANYFSVLSSSVEAHGPGTKEAAIAFIQFLSVPENMSLIVLEKKGAVLGSVRGVAVPPELDDWLNNSFPILPNISWLPASEPEGRKNANKTFEQWMKNMISDDEFAEQLNKYSQQDADQVIKSQNIDTSGWNLSN